MTRLTERRRVGEAITRIIEEHPYPYVFWTTELRKKIKEAIGNNVTDLRGIRTPGYEVFYRDTKSNDKRKMVYIRKGMMR